MPTRIYFIRHGESESNLIHQFAGSLNMPLTDKGREQALLTANHLKNVDFSAVYASDLSRAFETGRFVADAHNVPLTPERRLREIHAGEWEGETYSALEEKFLDTYGVWRTQIGLTCCPGGESVVQLQQRVCECVKEIVRLHPDQSVCVATHATPIRVMECLWTGTPLSLMHTIPWVGNASVTVAEYDGDGNGRLLYRDRTDHLGALRTVLANNV